MIKTFTDHNGQTHSLLGCVVDGRRKDLFDFDKEWISKANAMAQEKKCHVFWNLKKIDPDNYGDCQYFLVPIDSYDAERIPYLFNGHSTDYWIGIAYCHEAPQLSYEEMMEIRKPYLESDGMNGYEYEEQCADELRRQGFYDVEVTSKSGDQGIDVIAWKDGLKYGIQCKHYQNSVPNKAVQEAHTGAAYYDCDVAVVMTNSVFTESAKELAHKIGVKLWSSNEKYREV